MGFGDFSGGTTFQRTALIPGGLRIEAGCWTQTSDASAHIPTQLTKIIAFVCGSSTPNEVADISAGYIKCGLSTGNSICNYIAVGW